VNVRTFTFTWLRTGDLWCENLGNISLWFTDMMISLRWQVWVDSH